MTDIKKKIELPACFKASGASAGLKKDGAFDLALICADEACPAAAVFTTNLVQAAPVLCCRDKISRTGKAQAVIANSKNANACTGEQGLKDAYAMAEAAAEKLGIDPDHVLVASTGVIGHPLPLEKIKNAVPQLVNKLSVDGIDDAAKAIMTTDTFPKLATASCVIDGKTITCTGIVKGAGMIHPDMATMLCFVMTDAAADSAILDRILKSAVDSTFNCISVDGDTSTNDVVVLMANGRAGNKLVAEWGGEAEKLAEMVESVCRELAIQIVRDGEGVTKFVEVHVSGAPSDKAAKKVGATISTSMLVKTAMFGNDANWGRILAAAGRSGVQFDPNLVDISIGGLELMKAGTPLGFSEEKALEILKERDIKIDVNLHAGSGKAIYYTTDLSYDYIKINADYRT